MIICHCDIKLLVAITVHVYQVSSRTNLVHITEIHRDREITRFAMEYLCVYQAQNLRFYFSGQDMKWRYNFKIYMMLYLHLFTFFVKINSTS